MSLSDGIQLAVAIIGAIGVAVAIFSSIYSYKISNRTLSLMEKERTAAYRQAIYTKQADTYTDVLGDIFTTYETLIRSLYMYNEPDDNIAPQSRKKIFDPANMKYSASLSKARRCAFLMADDVNKKIEDFHVIAFKIILAGFDPKYDQDWLDEIPLKEAFEAAIEATRQHLSIDPLSRQTLSLINEEVLRSQEPFDTKELQNKKHDS